jgi:hypothetical protein
MKTTVTYIISCSKEQYFVTVPVITIDKIIGIISAPLRAILNKKHGNLFEI